MNLDGPGLFVTLSISAAKSPHKYTFPTVKNQKELADELLDYEIVLRLYLILRNHEVDSRLRSPGRYIGMRQVPDIFNRTHLCTYVGMHLQTRNIGKRVLLELEIKRAVTLKSQLKKFQRKLHLISELSHLIQTGISRGHGQQPPALPRCQYCPWLLNTMYRYKPQPVDPLPGLSRRPMLFLI